MKKEKFIMIAINAIEAQIRADNKDTLIWFNITKIKEIVEDIIKAVEFWLTDEKEWLEPVEQELVPLLPRDIVAITEEIITLDELGKVDEDRIHKILSKYWVPKQEEKEDYTDEEIQQWMNNIRWWTEEAREYGIKTIKWFLIFHWIHKGSFKKRSEMYISTPQATSVDEIAEDKWLMQEVLKAESEDTGERISHEDMKKRLGVEDTSVIDIDKEKSQNRFEIMIHDIESIMYTQLNTLRDSQTHDNRISIAKWYIKKRQEQWLLPIAKKFTREEIKKMYIDEYDKIFIKDEDCTYPELMVRIINNMWLLSD